MQQRLLRAAVRAVLEPVSAAGRLASVAAVRCLRCGAVRVAAPAVAELRGRRAAHPARRAAAVHDISVRRQRRRLQGRGSAAPVR